MKKYFISGIGTNVGKTLISAIVTEALQADYWKPVQCGITDGADKDKVKNLISNSHSVLHNEVYLLSEPASPHIAAAKENCKISKSNIQLPNTNNKLIIEGAGGLLVPLNDNEYVIDLAKQFDATVILVANSYLGCINHTLLSVDYLTNHNYKIQGLILNGNFEPGVRSAIVNYKNIPILAEIPMVRTADKRFVLEQASKINIYLF